MANTLLTPAAVTRKALQVLHQKLTFIGSINRQYDNQYAIEGAKIGSDLKIRLPNEYVVRTGATLSTQDTTEASETLSVSTQKGVDLNFTTAELTLDLQDFSDRIIEPAMAVLAANIEADALSMRNDIYNMVDNDGNPISFLNIMQGRQVLNDNLAPMDNKRCALLTTAHNTGIVDALKGLFQSSGNISKQYRDGDMGQTGGFMFKESTLADDHQSGAAAKTTGYLVNGAAQVGSTLAIDTGSNSLLKGDIFTIAGLNRVHPETKADTGQLQKFVVTANQTGAGNLSISPAIVITGGRQNVVAAPADNAALVKLGAGANELYSGSMVYHKDAFTFATADLLKPQGVHFCSRQVFDGISMRIVRDYDINNDKLPCRLDVLYGYKTIRAQLAARIHADG